MEHGTWCTQQQPMRLCQMHRNHDPQTNGTFHLFRTEWMVLPHMNWWKRQSGLPLVHATYCGAFDRSTRGISCSLRNRSHSRRCLVARRHSSSSRLGCRTGCHTDRCGDAPSARAAQPAALATALLVSLGTMQAWRNGFFIIGAVLSTTVLRRPIRKWRLAGGAPNPERRSEKSADVGVHFPDVSSHPRAR